jgi:hypothetical protein
MYSEKFVRRSVRQVVLPLSLAFAAVSGSAYSGLASGAGPTGQLWLSCLGVPSGNPDLTTDTRIAHINSDLSSPVTPITATNTGAFSAIGLDFDSGFVFTLDNGQGGATGERLSTYTLSGTFKSSTVVDSAADDDLFNVFVVNPQTHTLFADLFGGDYQDVNPTPPYNGTLHGADIIEITYNATSGAITSPYNPALNGGLGDTTNLNGLLLDGGTSSGSPSSHYADGRAFYLTNDRSTLYYIDDNNADPSSFWGFFTNGVYKVSTTGSVGGHNAPNPTLLSSQIQFPNTLNSETIDGVTVQAYVNGYLTGITVSEAKGIIYFTTNDFSNPPHGSRPTENAIWWMPIAGGTATKMTLPTGLSLGYPVFFANGMTIDQQSQAIYLSDSTSGWVMQLQLSADGHSFASGSNFYRFDSNAVADGAYASGLAFDVLPTLTLSATSTHAIEQSGGVTLLASAPGLTDIDNTRMASATVQITGGTFSSNETSANDDHLSIGSIASGTIGSISFSYNGATETLTLTGSDTLANYQSALSQVQYNTTGDNPTNYGNNTTRTLTWVVSDGAPNIPVPAQNSGTTTITIDAVNDPPSVSAGGTVSYTEQQATPVAIAPSLTTTDPDNLNLNSATVKITGFVAGDSLNFTNQNGVTGSYDGAGTLTLIGAVPIANYQTALRSVTFSTNSDNPTNYGANTSRAISFVVNDGLLNSTAATSTITVIAVNDPPVVAASGTVNYTERAAASVIDAAIAVSDVDNQNLAGGTVSISSGFFSGDMLNFTNQNGITGSYNSATGMLSLTGASTIANYQTALASVTFSSNSHNPTNYGAATTRTISYVVNDGTSNSAIGTSTVNIAAINDAPVNTVPGPQTAQENLDQSIAGLAIGDVDANPASDIVTTTLSVAHGTLTIASAGGATVTNGGTASVTLTGTQNQINTTLAASNNVIYRASTNYLGADTLTITTNDNGHTGAGGAMQTQNTVAITVTIPDEIFKDGFDGA